MEIELDKEYIEFIVTQMILDSVDLDHLNYFSLFEVFTIPATAQMGTPQASMCNSQMSNSHMCYSGYSVMPVKE